MMTGDPESVFRLKRDLAEARDELLAARKTIQRLRTNNTQLQERLAKVGDEGTTLGYYVIMRKRPDGTYYPTGVVLATDHDAVTAEMDRLSRKHEEPPGNWRAYEFIPTRVP